MGKKPHAVMLPLPLQGHINPMLHLADLLVSRHGFTITFVNTTFNHNRMRLPPSLSSQSDIRFVHLPDGLPPHHGRTTHLVDLLASVASHFPSSFHTLLRSLLLRSPPITCLISNSFLCFAQPIAAQHDLPYVAFWTQSATSYASILLVTDGYRPPKDDPSNLITCIPGAPPLKVEEMNTFVRSYDPHDFMFDYFTRPFKTIGKSDWILINSFDELEEETVAALQKEHPICTVGPLLPSSFFDDSQKVTTADPLGAEDDCLKWLDKRPPHSVLYVSFGTLAVMSAEDISEIALGLEASQQPFLWAVRADVMSGEAAIFPEGFLQRVEGRALIVSWAPQLQVLSHESVGGFLTHCGWNSVMEGISGGVPLLGWSSISDQPMNCRCVVDRWGVGMSLGRGKGGIVAREEVEKGVRELMEGERGKQARGRAKEWRVAARRATREGGSSLKNQQLFVDAMTSL